MSWLEPVLWVVCISLTAYAIALAIVIRAEAKYLDQGEPTDD